MPSAATGVNLNVIILSEDSQIKGNTTRYLLHVGYKRKIQMHLFTKTETSYKNKNLFTKTQTQNTNLWLPKEGGGRQTGISKYKPLHVKQRIRKVLLYSTENYIQYPIIDHNVKESEKEYMCIYAYICV